MGLGLWWFRVDGETLYLEERPLPIVPGRRLARLRADLALGVSPSFDLGYYLMLENAKTFMAHLEYDPARRAVVAVCSFILGECGKLGFVAAAREVAGLAEAKSFEVARRFGGKTPHELAEGEAGSWEEGEDEIWE